MSAELPKRSYELGRNGIIVCIQKWESHKLPVLALMIENENTLYKVASFDSEEKAKWFIEMMEEFFDGLVYEDKGQ